MTFVTIYALGMVLGYQLGKVVGRRLFVKHVLGTK